jgi:DNA-binding MarR family transcriptional regulator
MELSRMSDTDEDSRDIEQLEWMFFSTIRRINRSMDTHSKELEKQYGLTLSQLDVLLAVAETPSGPVGQIAQQVHLSKATLTNIADRLVRHGLLTRQRSTHDKRQIHLSLTPKARESLEQGPRPFHSAFSHHLQSLPRWERTQLLSSLQHVAALMDARRSAAATAEAESEE